ncbi:MAG: TIGR04282 family arsenosugar biosynthesis glycosyltransferase [Rhodanobacter sp.]
MKSALAIFVKTPKFSPVKTRLAATLGTTDALTFYTLACAATAAVARGCPSLAPYWAVAEAEPEAHAAWPDFPRIGQGEGGLGARMGHVYAELQARHGQVLLIGADAPQLTTALLECARATLDDATHPFALGLAADGGFWLFGGSRPIPQSVWIDVRYSQPDTAAQLRSALASLGSVITLPELSDVDVEADLPALAESLDALSNPLPAQRELAAWLHTVLDRQNVAGSPG